MEEQNAQQFANIDELENAFVSDKSFNFPEEMVVNGIPYKISKSSSYDMRDIIARGVKPLVGYGTFKRKEAQEVGMNQFIVFLWGYRNNVLIPHDVKTLSGHRLVGRHLDESAEKLNVDKEKILGVTTELQISNIPGCPPIKAKVDTGADVSSIHAEEWSTQNGQVSFISPDISPNRITLPVIEKQAIKSSNGDIEYRPVVELDVKVNGVPMSGVMFNLNDRGSMEYSVLIGKNILERGGFLIDPKIVEEDYEVDLDEEFDFDWETLAEEFADEEVSEWSVEITEADVIEYIKNNT